MLQSHLTSIQSQGIVESDFGMSAHLLSTPVANAFTMRVQYIFETSSIRVQCAHHPASQHICGFTPDLLPKTRLTQVLETVSTLQVLACFQFYP